VAFDKNQSEKNLKKRQNLRINTGKTPEFEDLGKKNQSNTQVVGVKTGVGLSSCGV